MITDIRNYIKNSINAVTRMEQIDDPFGDIDVSEREFKTGYKIIFGAMTTARGGNYITRSTPVDVQIFQKAFRGLTEDFDELYEKAVKIEDEIFDYTKEKNDFTDLESGGITPDSLTDNNRIITMNINLSFRTDCSFN